MSRLTAILTAFLLLVPHAMAEELPWLEDWDEAFRIAKAERKLVFVDFNAEWCGPCRMMERDVFPAPAVQERLREYVLLRVDVDRSRAGRKLGNRGVPTYALYDSGERRGLSLTGGMKAEAFVRRLDALREAAPFLLQASELFAQKKDFAAWTEVAKGCTKAGAAVDAREAWQRVQRAAPDRAAAQTAEINAAFTWAIEGKAAKSVELLKKITRTPANSETEALCWFVLGRACVKMKDLPAARAAFEKATTLVASDHVVAREARTALADLR